MVRAPNTKGTRPQQMWGRAKAERRNTLCSSYWRENINGTKQASGDFLGFPTKATGHGAIVRSSTMYSNDPLVCGDRGIGGETRLQPRFGKRSKSSSGAKGQGNDKSEERKSDVVRLDVSLHYHIFRLQIAKRQVTETRRADVAQTSGYRIGKPDLAGYRDQTRSGNALTPFGAVHDDLRLGDKRGSGLGGHPESNAIHSLDYPPQHRGRTVCIKVEDEDQHLDSSRRRCTFDYPFVTEACRAILSH